MFCKFLRLVALTTLSFIAFLASAQPYCRVRTFNVRDGLPSNNVSTIAQDSEGLIWASTWNGLSYFDGYNFKSFRSSEENGWLSTNRILMIKHNGNDDIWVVTYDRQLYLFDAKATKFINVGEAIAEKIGRNFQPRNIYPMAAGHTWITGHGDRMAIRIDDNNPTDTESMVIINPNEKNSRGILHSAVNDKAGNEWLLFSDHIELADSDISATGHFEFITNVGEATYIATQRGDLFIYHPGAKALNSLKSPVEFASINCMSALDDNNLILGTSNGIYLYDCRKGKSRAITTGAAGTPAANVTDIYVDSQRRIWAYTSADGIILADPNDTTAKFIQTSAESKATTKSRHTLWLEDQFGTIWLVPRGGVFGYYDEASDHIVPYPLQSPHFGFADVPEIERFFIDNGSNLWLSSFHDLMLVNFKRPIVNRIPLIKNQETRSLLARDDGTIWAGTSGGYIGVYDSTGKFLHYLGFGRGGQLITSQTPVIFSDKIYSIFEDSYGTIWIGTKGQGLYVIDPKGKIDHYCYDKSAPFSLNCNNIYDFDEDEKGNIWVATYGGGINLALTDNRNNINFIHAGNVLETYPMEELQNVRRITHDGLGNVLASCSEGLIVFSNKFSDPSKIRFNVTRQNKGEGSDLRTGNVMQTLVTNTGNIIVSTMGGDVQTIRESNILKPGLTFKAYGPENIAAIPALAEGNVLSLIEDNNGNICVVSDASMVIYDPQTANIISLGPNELGENIEFTEGLPALNTKNNHLLLPTVGGLISFSPEDLKQSTHSPKIIFTNVMYQGTDENISILHDTRLEVPSDKRDLSVEFAALDYGSDKSIHYAYKLEGTDEDWTYSGASNTARLTHLMPGMQRLLVKSTNADGVWTDNVHTLEIYVTPTFWETPVAKLLYFFIAIFLVIIGLHVYELRRKNAMHQEVDEMKNKFFADMSHKLRTPLTLIGGPANEVLQSSSITETDRRHLRTVLRNTDNMLELVNKMLRWSHDNGVYISDENVVSVASIDDLGEYPDHEKYDSDPQTVSSPKSVKLLIVEDNDELRRFLRDILSPSYTVESAANGREGLEKAEKWQPDFIITDVMMPEMDGLTMVSHIKQNTSLSHIPIIVLSAKASVADRVLGLKMGIDDYITKPFSASYLKQRIANIILQRRTLQQKYLEIIGTQKTDSPDSRQPDNEAEAPCADYHLESPQITDADQEMMTRLLQFLETRIEDENLKIEELADAVNLGRTVFYGKIKSLVGVSPSDFLRHIRMQRAAELIAKSKMNFSQIAFNVGFSDPKYFTKCFKKETGMTPSEYRTHMRKKSEETVEPVE